MLKKLSTNPADLLFIVIASVLLLGLTIRLLPQGYIIAGHDSGLALDSKAFLETRLYAWDERINFGQDNSLLFGSLTIHTLDYFFSLLSGTDYAGNQLNLFFWLSLVFVSAFIFAYQFREKLGKNFVYIFPFIILFNFYIFQSIFILERAKYSLVSASLLFLTLITLFLNKKISLFKGAVVSSITFSIFNGGSWLGLPLFGGLLIILLTLFVFYLIADLKILNFKRSLNFLSFLVLTGVFFALINSYSLFPYLQTFIKKDYMIIQNTATLDSNKAWLDYISQGSSFLNIFRMQGVPDWYQTKFSISEMHPYANFYSSNSLFIFISYLIPIVAFASLGFVKNSDQKKIIGFAGAVSLLSMVFMSGSRSPLGFIYEFLYNNVPGFIIFRSSFYKFGYAFIIAYAVLLAFSFSSLIDLITNLVKSKSGKKLLNLVLVILVIGGWLFYHQKLLDNNIFNWRTDASTKIEIPSYVDDYKIYVKDQNLENGRTLLLPKFHQVWLSDGYNWGYWSLSTIHYSLTKQPIISYDQNLTSPQKDWLTLLYDAIENKDPSKTKEISSRLGISKFLLKKDGLAADQWAGYGDPVIYENNLESFEFIEKEREFGSWVLYKIKSPTPPLFTAENTLVELTSPDIKKIESFLTSRSAYLNSDIPNSKLIDFTSQKIDNYECKSCLLESSTTYYQLVWPRILPNSLLFPLKVWNEENKLKKITDSTEKINYNFGLILKRAAEVDAMFYAKMHDAYIVNNLNLIRRHLDEIITITKNSRDPNNFEYAKNTLDSIHSVELKLSREISPKNQTPRSDLVKEEISATIWKIEEMKNFYSPILKDKTRWQKEKIFEFSIPENSLPYDLYLDEKSLPSNPVGNMIPPKPILNNIETQISSEKIGNWIKIPSENLKIGKNSLTLEFPNPVNLFQTSPASETIVTPLGPRRCYTGKIKQRFTGETLHIKVKGASGAMYFFSKEDTAQGVDGFLQWNKAMRIDNETDFVIDHFSIFYPAPKSEAPITYFICGEDQNPPIFQEFIIEEIYTPKIIGIKKSQTVSDALPQISYQRINATEYKVQAKSVDHPFILRMNQKFSPLWVIKNNQTGEKVNYSTFPIDLYAQAWVVDSKGDLDLVIEYEPQEYFRTGLKVTVGFLIVIAGYLLLTLLRK